MNCSCICLRRIQSVPEKMTHSLAIWHWIRWMQYIPSRSIRHPLRYHYRFDNRRKKLNRSIGNTDSDHRASSVSFSDGESIAVCGRSYSSKVRIVQNALDRGVAVHVVKEPQTPFIISAKLYALNLPSQMHTHYGRGGSTCVNSNQMTSFDLIEFFSCHR